MENLKLNNASVRTSNNFGINDITVELDIPEVKEFNNAMILSYESDSFEISDLFLGVSKNKLNTKIGLKLNKNYGITLTIPENVKIEHPINLDFDFDEENIVLIDNIKIVMEKNSKADFILKYKSDEGKYFHYLKQENIIKENANCTVAIANLMSQNSDSFIAIENEIEKNGKLQHTIVDFGGNNKISNYYSKVQGDFAENNLKTIYLGNNNDTIDINYNIDILGKNAKCNIEAQGALNDSARKNFKGIIDFKEGSSKSKGLENENCMILSENAKSKSLPMLLCHEEDVEGEHGVSSGKIDEAKLFYIMTKGISYDDAKKLIVKANFSSIVSKIRDKELQKEILEQI